jgi:hypothetical protein
MTHQIASISFLTSLRRFLVSSELLLTLELLRRTRSARSAHGMAKCESGVVSYTSMTQMQTLKVIHRVER